MDTTSKIKILESYGISFHDLACCLLSLKPTSEDKYGQWLQWKEDVRLFRQLVYSKGGNKAINEFNNILAVK